MIPAHPFSHLTLPKIDSKPATVICANQQQQQQLQSCQGDIKARHNPAQNGADMDYNGPPGSSQMGGLGARSASSASSHPRSSSSATPSRTPSTPGATSTGGRLSAGTPSTSRGARTPGTPSGGSRLGRTPGGGTPVGAMPGSGHSRTPSSGGRTPATPVTPGGGGRERRSGRVSLGSIGPQSSSSSGGDRVQPAFYRSLSGTTPVSPGGRSLAAVGASSPAVSTPALPRSYPASPAVHNGQQQQQQQQHPATTPSSTSKTWFAIYDYSAQGEDELELRKGDVIEVLSKDYKISGDEGWWTGKCGGKVGVFPCNFVAPCDQDFSDVSQVTIIK